MLHILESCECSHDSLFGDVRLLQFQVGNDVDYDIVVGDYVRKRTSGGNPFKPCKIVK